MTIAKSAQKEAIYECEVERRKLSPNPGRYLRYWKVKSVRDAIVDGDTEFRCKDCGGAVKIHGKRIQDGTGPYVDHRHREDSEYCPGGLHFLNATDGRSPRRASEEVRLGMGK
jgi:hypothetical protein